MDDLETKQVTKTTESQMVPTTASAYKIEAPEEKSASKKVTRQTEKKDVLTLSQDAEEYGASYMSYASAWINAGHRIRAKAPSCAYESIQKGIARTVVRLMQATNRMFAMEGCDWVLTLGATRRYLPEMGAVIINSTVADKVGSTPQERNVQIISQFQMMLRRMGFSFNNLLVNTYNVTAMAEMDPAYLMATVDFATKYLQAEMDKWNALASMSLECDLDDADETYLNIEENVTNQPEPLSGPNPWIDLLREHSHVECEPPETWDSVSESVSYDSKNSQHEGRPMTPPDQQPSIADLGGRQLVTGRSSRQRGVQHSVHMARTVNQASSSVWKMKKNEEEEAKVDADPARRGLNARGRGDPDSFGGSMQFMPMISPALMGIQPLTDFDGTASTRENREWMDRFEFIAASGGWPTSQRILTVEQYLKGPAKDWYQLLNRTTRADWTSLKTKFIDEFCVDSRTAMHLYSRAQQRANEGLLAFFRRLTNLAKKADVLPRTTKDIQAHVDLFVDGLRTADSPPDLQLRDFRDVAEVEKLLKRYERVHKGISKLRGVPSSDSDEPVRTKTKPRRTGVSPSRDKKARLKKAAAYLAYAAALSDESEEEYLPYAVTDDEGHESIYYAKVDDKVQRRERDRRYQRDDREVETCTTCHRKGHGAAKCWLNTICKACGSTGHPAEFCYRKCGFCDTVHERKGPCPMRDSVKDLVTWARAMAERHNQDLPKLPKEVLNM